MKTLGVIGLGFVGTAVWEGMKHAFDLAGYDKQKGFCRHTDEPQEVIDISARNPYQHLMNLVDGPIFICVPTPMNPDGSCNTTIVCDVVGELNRINNGHKPRVVVIKSTVVPGTTERIGLSCPNLHVCFNPEFLTERNAIDDFKNQDRIIIGGPHAGTKVLKQVYNTAYPDVPVTKTSATIAEMVKYTTNSFLATKVAFANEIERVCQGLDIDYDKVIEYATKDKRLGNSHWSVPGPDGKKGFGGSCFPKDLNGLIALSKHLGINPQVMQGAWQSNLESRLDRDWETLKGRAVS